MKRFRVYLRCGKVRLFVRLAMMVIVAIVMPVLIADVLAQNQAEVGSLGTGFTYQGYLEESKSPVDGVCDFQFSLWDSAGDSAGQIGVTQTLSDVAVIDGVFMVVLNRGEEFGIDAFAGDTRWLQIAARCPAEGGTYVTLSPRQELLASPYALHSLSTGALQGNPVAVGAPGVGQVLKWDGGAWRPSTDDSALYTAGTGLNLDGTEFSVDINAVQQRVAGACEEGYAVRRINADGSVVCEMDDNALYTAGTGLDLSGTEFSVDIDAVQQRVTGACEVGYAVRQINADGSVVCEPHDARPGFSIITLDGMGSHGANLNQITIGVDGLPLIVYDGDYDVKVAHCDDMVCTTSTRSVLESVGGIAPAISIAIGSDGLGLITYITEDGLKVAHCNNVACTSASVATIDTSWIDESASIIVGPDGLGLIGYYDRGNGAIKVAHCDDVACTSATITTLESMDPGVPNLSITIGADGLGLFVYNDVSAGKTKMVHCDDVACTSATITALSRSGSDLSITTGLDGFGLISYRSNSNLYVSHCSNADCTSTLDSMLDGKGNTGYYTSITVGSDGLGLISYYDTTDNQLKVAHCRDVACTGASLATVEGIDYGLCSSITVGSDGLPVISYFYHIYGANVLKVAHCSNSFCVPYFRRR
jgi:hypothetical protein